MTNSDRYESEDADLKIDLTGKVAIVTGAGSGLGRAHAKLLAERGARVVVNDLGTSLDGKASVSRNAFEVVENIRASGGEAMENSADVTDVAQVKDMVDAAHRRWGSVDILVNNAGFLRDRTFAKAALEDMRAVIEVHLFGSLICTKAVWPLMQEAGSGRIVMTTSSSGLYGNFGQSAYASAKMALVGLMNTLHLEGERHDIRVNCLSPSATTRMTETLHGADAAAFLSPEAVSAGLLALVGDHAPSRTILCAGGGAFESAHITLTKGRFIGAGADAGEIVLSSLPSICDRHGETVPRDGWEQSKRERELAEEAARC